MGQSEKGLWFLEFLLLLCSTFVLVDDGSIYVWLLKPYERIIKSGLNWNPNWVI